MVSYLKTIPTNVITMFDFYSTIMLVIDQNGIKRNGQYFSKRQQPFENKRSKSWAGCNRVNRRNRGSIVKERRKLANKSEMQICVGIFVGWITRCSFVRSWFKCVDPRAYQGIKDSTMPANLQFRTGGLADRRREPEDHRGWRGGWSQ